MTASSFVPFARAVMRQRALLVPSRAQSVPRPDDKAHGLVTAQGGYRVLIVGSDYAISWGVRTNALGLPGQLARELSHRTGTGTDVTVMSDPGMSITGVLRVLEGQDLTLFDSVVVITGIGDAYRLVPPVRWVVQMQQLLGRLLMATPVSTPINVVGIQPASSVTILKTKLDGAVDRWGKTLNLVTEGVCGRYDRVHYLDAPDAESGNLDDTDRIRFKSPAVYQAWAIALARHLVPLLASSKTYTGEGSADVAPVVQDAAHRVAALKALDLPASTAAAPLRAVVRRARDLFQTPSAAFTVVTDRAVFNQASLGIAAASAPIEESFCGMTVSSSGPFVVEDAWNDPRVPFRTPVRFYAGYPVTAPDGTRIGALCVFDTEPRSEASIDTGFLRELADDITDHLTSSAKCEVIPAA